MSTDSKELAVLHMNLALGVKHPSTSLECCKGCIAANGTAWDALMWRFGTGARPADDTSKLCVTHDGITF